MAIIIHPKRPRGPGKKNKETNGNVFLIINLIISKRKCIQSLSKKKNWIYKAIQRPTIIRRCIEENIYLSQLRVYLGCCLFVCCFGRIGINTCVGSRTYQPPAGREQTTINQVRRSHVLSITTDSQSIRAQHIQNRIVAPRRRRRRRSRPLDGQSATRLTRNTTDNSSRLTGDTFLYLQRDTHHRQTSRSERPSIVVRRSVL